MTALAAFLNGQLTANYVDLTGEFSLSAYDKDGALFIDYAKGTEASAEMKIETMADDAAEPVILDLFQEGLDTAAVLSAKEYTLPAASAKIRIPLHFLQKDKKFKVSVKATTPGATAGTIKLYAKFENKSFAPSASA